MRRASAGAAGENAEERLDIGVSAHIPVTVEVGVAGAGRGRTGAGEAGEERLDVRVGAHIPVTVEVGAAAGGHLGVGDVIPVDDAAGGRVVTDEAAGGGLGVGGAREDRDAPQ